MVRDKAWAKSAANLANIMKDMSIEADFTQFFASSYDDPMKLWGRRNEVMFVVTEK